MSDISPIPDPEDREPLWSVARLTAGATAVLALLTAWAVPITAEQETAVLGVVAVLAPLVVAWIGRGRVWAPATVAKLLRR